MTTKPAGASPVDRGVGRLDPERAEFVAWLRAYAKGGDNWRDRVLMGEHDIALALWLDRQRQIDRLTERLHSACNAAAHQAAHAHRRIEALEALLLKETPDAERYRWLRERDLDTVHAGGVFAGRTPDNVVLNGADLDTAIDAAMASHEPPNVRVEPGAAP